MKCLRLKATYAVALMLLSLMLNTNAYGNGKDRLWTRVSERLISATVNKLPPSLAKKIIPVAAMAAFVCGAHICDLTVYSGKRLQPIKKSVDITKSLPGSDTVVITLKGVDASELQRGGLALDGAYILPLDVETSAEKHRGLMKLQNDIEEERDVVWLEISENNELQAFRYGYEINLSRVALHLAIILAGRSIFRYARHGFHHPKYPHLDHYPHPVIGLILIAEGGLLFLSGVVGVSINLGMGLP